MLTRQDYWLACSVCIITLCGCGHSDADAPARGVLGVEKASVNGSSDPNVVDVRGVSKLLRAVDLGDEEQVRKLLAAGGMDATLKSMRSGHPAS